TRSGAAQGDTMLAVNALLMQFYLLFSYVMDGFAYAGEALGGKFYGAADRPSFLSLTRWLYAWGAALTLAFSFVYFFFGTPLLTLLTDDLSVVRAATAYLPYACILPLCGVAAFLFDGLCIGTTSSRLMLLSVGVGALAFFAVQYSASLLFAPNDALWLAKLAFLTVRGLVLAFCYRRLLP
ncbi:MAG: MATE family efflux transporter, partial [Alloprevotella sp.]|nr:MATE family efflux transporter [Alloprevotella sp.]